MSQVNATASEPTPVPERPTLYMMVYSVPGSSQPWASSYPRESLKDTQNYGCGYSGSVLVTIPGSRPTTPPAPRAEGDGLGWEWMDPDDETIVAAFRSKAAADAFNDGAMIVRPRSAPSTSGEVVAKELADRITHQLELYADRLHEDGEHEHALVCQRLINDIDAARRAAGVTP